MDAKILGAFICSQRKALHLTQKDLAKQIGVTDKAISKWERRGGLPDINMLEPLAVALNLDLAEIVKCEKIENKSEDTDQMNEVIRETLKFTRLKIKKTVSVCIPALVIAWILMIAGACITVYDIRFITSGASFWIALLTMLLGNILRQLRNINNEIKEVP